MSDEPDDDDADEIDVSFHGDRLELTVGPKALPRVLASLEELVPVDQRQVFREITFRSVWITGPASRPWVWNHWGTPIGCLVVATTVVSIFLVGLVTLVKAWAEYWFAYSN